MRNNFRDFLINNKQFQEVVSKEFSFDNEIQIKQLLQRIHLNSNDKYTFITLLDNNSNRGFLILLNNDNIYKDFKNKLENKKYIIFDKTKNH